MPHIPGHTLTPGQRLFQELIQDEPELTPGQKMFADIQREQQPVSSTEPVPPPAPTVPTVVEQPADPITTRPTAIERAARGTRPGAGDLPIPEFDPTAPVEISRIGRKLLGGLEKASRPFAALDEIVLQTGQDVLADFGLVNRPPETDLSFNPVDIVNQLAAQNAARPLGVQIGGGLATAGITGGTALTRNVLRNVPTPRQIGPQIAEQAVVPPPGVTPVGRPGPLEFPTARPTELAPRARNVIPELPAIPNTLRNTTGLLKPLSPEVESTIGKLTGQVSVARPLQRDVLKANAAARKLETAERVSAASKLERSLRAQGVSAQEANRQSTALLEGPLPKPTFTALDMLADEARPLFDHISDLNMSENLQYFQGVNARVAMEKVIAGELPAPAEIKLLERIFGGDFSSAILGKRDRIAKFGEQVVAPVECRQTFSVPELIPVHLVSVLEIAVGLVLKYVQECVALEKEPIRPG